MAQFNVPVQLLFNRLSPLILLGAHRIARLYRFFACFISVIIINELGSISSCVGYYYCTRFFNHNVQSCLEMLLTGCLLGQDTFFEEQPISEFFLYAEDLKSHM
ncbi:hypothetical protein BT93_F0560 [Corymbia citriodora subsp. variegata]|nr:hypothetical protein BT93_F0560 [Corymbia citriodora subsp. variegata]